MIRTKLGGCKFQTILNQDSKIPPAILSSGVSQSLRCPGLLLLDQLPALFEDTEGTEDAFALQLQVLTQLGWEEPS